jgi:hypothetical protein
MLANTERNNRKFDSLRELTAVYFENYLVTSIKLISRDRKDYFGTFTDGKFVEKLEAKIVLKAWQEIPSQFNNCTLGNFGVTPNDFNGILKIDSRLSDETSIKYVPTIISSFKARSTKLLNQLHGTHARIFWENGYVEKPIENLNDLSEILNNISSHK